MMVLLNGDREEAMVLTNAAGRFIIRAPTPGSFTVRADRIGHAGTTSAPFTLSPGDTVDLRLVAEVSAIQLEGLEVSGEARCDIRPEAGRAVATVWEEARKALAAAALTEEKGLYRYRTIRFSRDLEKDGRRVLSEQRRASQGYLRVPFESLPAETLISRGFIQTDPEGDLYFAPDANVLLSDPFLDTHCLGIRAGRDDTAGLLGVSFEPISGRELPDIRGVVWVDPGTGELSHLDYTYDNLDPALRSEAVGGKVVFQGLPDGTWIVTEWRIRMPTAALSTDFRGGRQIILAGIREVGGEVDRIQDQAGRTVLEAARATLTGVILDSTGIAPLSGARVELAGTRLDAITDSVGAFRIPEVSEGVYAVAFSHPEVPALGGLPEPAEVELTAGNVTSIRLVFPSISEILAAACPEPRRPDGSAVLTGMVRDGETGTALAGATVRVLWTDLRFRATEVVGGSGGRWRTMAGMGEQGLEGQSDETGRYLICSVPSDFPLRLEAETEVLTSGTLALRVPPDQPLLSRDIPVVRSGSGSITGVTVDWEDRKPLEGVRVALTDLDLETLSDGNGRFSFPGVPLGRHLLEAEILGRGTVTDTVRVRPDGELRLELRLPTRALEIEGVSIRVISRREMEFRQDGFSGGRMDVMTPEEIDAVRDRVTNVVDLIRTMGSPRIRVSEETSHGFPMGFCIHWTRRETSVEAGRQRAAGAEVQGSQNACQSMLVVVDGIPRQDIGGGRAHDSGHRIPPGPLPGGHRKHPGPLSGPGPLPVRRPGREGRPRHRDPEGRAARRLVHSMKTARASVLGFGLAPATVFLPGAVRFDGPVPRVESPRTFGVLETPASAPRGLRPPQHRSFS